MPKVSIIIATYNRADMVRDAIRSVLDQTYTDWELIVVDDGSKDDTRAVVEQFSDVRIHYLYQDNKGLPGARNTGIQAACGHFIAFLDSDDLFLPHKLERQAELLETNQDLGVVAAGHIEVNGQLQVLREVSPWRSHPRLELSDWLQGCPFVPASVLVRREWLERVGLFDEGMHYVEDWDLWLRMSYAGCAMGWLQEPVCLYRIHGGNMVRDVGLMKAGMLAMLEKLYSQPGLPAEVLALRDKAYANAYLNAAARAYAASDGKEGKDCLREAIRRDPALATGALPRALDALAGFALTPLCANPTGFMDLVAGNLPQDTGLPRWARRKGRGLLQAVAAFEFYQRKEYPSVVRHAALALWHDPGWLRNRGLLSVAGRALWREAARWVGTRS